MADQLWIDSSNYCRSAYPHCSIFLIEEESFKENTGNRWLRYKIGYNELLHWTEKEECKVLKAFEILFFWKLCLLPSPSDLEGECNATRDKWLFLSRQERKLIDSMRRDLLVYIFEYQANWKKGNNLWLIINLIYRSLGHDWLLCIYHYCKM